MYFIYKETFPSDIPHVCAVDVLPGTEHGEVAVEDFVGGHEGALTVVQHQLLLGGKHFLSHRVYVAGKTRGKSQHQTHADYAYTARANRHQVSADFGLYVLEGQGDGGEKAH